MDLQCLRICSGSHDKEAHSAPFGYRTLVLFNAAQTRLLGVMADHIGYRHHPAAERNSIRSGLMSTLKSSPSTCDSLDSIVNDGSCSPASSRAIAGCCIPSILASAV